ncbi:MAG: DUF1615 domain-containing protein [Arenimonas sp.]
MNRLSARKALCLGLLVAALALAACGPEPPRPRTPAEARARVELLLPPGVRDRGGWAKDIQVAFAALEIEPSDANLCSVLAVTAQESTFSADPEVPGLPKIARAEIVRRAASLHIPEFFVRAALQVESPDGRTYDERLAKVRTEKQLSDLFEEMIAEVPLGKRVLGRANPVRTGGPMQVRIAFAQEHARRWPYPYTDAGSMRDEVFSRRGGMYFGIAHLLGYEASYTQPLHRFADYNAGLYASRNAAFQQAASRVSGTTLALDGDLVIRERKRGQRVVSATEMAVRTLGPRLELTDAQIHRALAKGARYDFERTPLYQRLFALADAQAGLKVPRAVIPRIDLESPKITRKLTTEWFAMRVDQRFRQCMARANG